MASKHGFLTTFVNPIITKRRNFILHKMATRKKENVLIKAENPIDTYALQISSNDTPSYIYYNFKSTSTTITIEFKGQERW
jgi:hypothetical protein